MGSPDLSWFLLLLQELGRIYCFLLLLAGNYLNYSANKPDFPHFVCMPAKASWRLGGHLELCFWSGSSGRYYPDYLLTAWPLFWKWQGYHSLKVRVQTHFRIQSPPEDKVIQRLANSQNECWIYNTDHDGGIASSIVGPNKTSMTRTTTHGHFSDKMEHLKRDNNNKLTKRMIKISRIPSIQDFSYIYMQSISWGRMGDKKNCQLPNTAVFLCLSTNSYRTKMENVRSFDVKAVNFLMDQ